MRAIILAAGQGTRLKPLTDHSPKCLVEYRGRPIIEYSLAALKANCVKEIVVVAGHRAEKFNKLNVKTVINNNFATTNMVASLFTAEEYLAGDLIISYGDIIYTPEVIKKLLMAGREITVVVDTDWLKLWQKRMADPLSDAETLKLDSMGNIKELGKKPSSYSEIEAQYIGLIKISGSVINQVKNFYHSLDKSKLYDGRSYDQMYMTTFLQLIIDRLMPVAALKISGGWLEFDTEEDLKLEIAGLSRS